MRFFSVVSKHETEYHILILLPSSGRKIWWRKNCFLICCISCVSFTNRSWNLELSSNLYWRRDREQKVEDTLWKIPCDTYIWPLSLVVYCPGKLMCLMGSGNYPSCFLWKKLYFIEVWAVHEHQSTQCSQCKDILSHPWTFLKQRLEGVCSYSKPCSFTESNCA